MLNVKQIKKHREESGIKREIGKRVLTSVGMFNNAIFYFLASDFAPKTCYYKF